MTTSDANDRTRLWKEVEGRTISSADLLFLVPIVLALCDVSLVNHGYAVPWAGMFLLAAWVRARMQRQFEALRRLLENSAAADTSALKT